MGDEKGRPVSRVPGAARGRVEERLPFGALVRKCWFPEDVSGRRCLGPGLTAFTEWSWRKRKRVALSLIEQLVNSSPHVLSLSLSKGSEWHSG